ncbi:hypothetical protein PSU4_20110 [Pseudonocardia sulfidoxydans NBRC 16205]|uniref:DUF2399 domain-containing protein n=1 Tax=Pseudonocardia sulfidoxydans NBRC 16205 TaxID=1223511 RepID=A0A511DEU2_9PSEU|nr:hypothetical protein PSU4_20110 [Pseudonocardia sulfidoxydans NBRC 16205]
MTDSEIAAYVAAKTGAVPWRMTSSEYVAAVPEHGPPAGRLTSVPWDPELVEAMRRHSIAVVEERVSDSLLDDLAVAVDRRRGRS